MRALSDLLPIRTTADWEGFREVQIIPHRYGNTGGKLIQYDQQRRKFVWADHTCKTISKVTVGGQDAFDWQFKNGTDSAGKPVCFVEFAQPVDDGAEAVAFGIGKMHATTGVVLTNPADIVHDVLANIAGNSVSSNQLFQFRDECRALNLTIAGSIADESSIQSVIASICQSIGAVYSSGIKGIGKIYPGGLDAGAAIFTVNEKATVSATCDVADLINSIIVQFDYVDGEPRQTIEADCKDSISKYGKRQATIEAQWVIDGRIAFDVAKRRLEAFARPQWAIVADGVRGIVSPASNVTIDNPNSPVTGAQLALSVLQDLQANRSNVAFRVPIGPVPAVRLVRQSRVHDPIKYASATARTEGDQRVITLTKESGEPYANVQVVLNGSVTRVSDAGGNVTFPISLMPQGEHTLTIKAEGGDITIRIIVT